MSRSATQIRLRAIRWALLFAAMVAGASIPAQAQYPGRIKKDADTTPPLRATGVFEWTGDLSKPTAGRLVPIAVWDGQQYQPGGLYLAQPAPITVYSGTVYELEQAGTAKGLFQVSGAENLGGTWIAIGSVKPEVIVAKAKPPMSKHPPQVVKDADSDRPTLHRKAGSDGGDSGTGSGSGTNTSQSKNSQSNGSQNGGSQTGSGSGGDTSSADSDHPTLHRRDSGDSGNSGSGSSGGGDSGSTQSAPSSDPDRPTLHRKDSGDSSSGGSSNAPSVDPDRPTLHKRTDKAGNDTGAPVSATANIDPDRPKLRYGKPETLEGTVAPSKLEGLPMDMNQMAAISDAKQGEQHTYAYSWADPGDAAKMQAAMEDLARKALTGKQASPQPIGTRTVAKSAPSSATVRHKAAAQPAPPALELADEKFNAFELSYSGGATLVLTAKTVGDTAKYVTLIAQPDFYGVPQVVFQQVTSDERLEITPRMRLVDAVDTDADHRAELIFELRSKTGRSFAIYRVVNRRVEEAFNTGQLP